MPEEDLLFAGGRARVRADEDIRWAVPGDEGVFLGGKEVDGLRLVHPVQAYLDLKADPAGSSAIRQRIRNLICTRNA
jgi:hypothetical protein